jgi:hypothetical protein
MKMKGEKQTSTLDWTDHAVHPLTQRAAGLFALIAEWVHSSEKRRELWDSLTASCATSE